MYSFTYTQPLLGDILRTKAFLSKMK